MFITAKRCNQGYNAGCTADGSEWVRGPYLVLMSHPTERYADETKKLHAFVRRATMRKDKNGVSGTIVAKLDNRDITLHVEGTYGNNGLPCQSGFRNHADKSVRYELRPLVNLWDVAHEVPEELTRMYWGSPDEWHGAGSEEHLAFRAWAEENQELLRRWRLPSAEKAA